MATENSKPRGRPRGSKIDPFRSDVGVLTDAEVAKKAGVSVSAVKLYRDRHSIPPALPQGATRRARDRKAASPSGGAASPRAERAAAPEAKRGPGRKSRVTPLHDLGGSIPDGDVEMQAGVTTNAVQMYRKKHGIAPASGVARGARRGRPPKAASTATTSAAPARRGPGRPPKAVASRAGGQFGWRIRIADGKGESVRIAVAPNAAAACAAGSTLGDVIGLERLAEAMM
jgi:hypothetical protein